MRGKKPFSPFTEKKEPPREEKKLVSPLNKSKFGRRRRLENGDYAQEQGKKYFFPF